ncbi:MarR family winged helix-turn-helix transcriptional regulator [Streptomyces sp. ME19-01-6]|uniref:MarR family winged helix-turn-helix transcriptional regulator n=1 Tax=Streptomyces sp. ME19-01-6 TaxID=3028686 RepID=UPI0029B19EC9|nr:MarR family transcriptional regulator [Streptomyces sp. ME19-01-6]MDX3225395.1 MarR family transcriptional regulator [Streptomyces sp. ME19-01-6]
MAYDDEGLRGLLPAMTRLSSALSRGQLFERATAAAGTTLERPAVTILVILDAADRPLRVGEIARRMQVAGPHATRQVHGLEQRGLVERVADPDDQRARLITLTAAGEKLTGRYLRVINGWFADALAGWSDADRRDLVLLLGRMVDDLSAHLETVTGDTGDGHPVD